MLHSHLIFSPNLSLSPSQSILSPFLSPSPSSSSSSSSSHHFFIPSISVRTLHRSRLNPCLAQLPEEDGPIELPPSSNTLEDGPLSFSNIFATSDDPSPIQVATSVLLTGSITVFLFRSLRRRAKRAKELKFRSTGATKSIKEEALDSLKAIKLNSIEPDSPPSPIQALLGGITAGIIALILYKFTTTIEAGLNRQSIPDNFSVRQITITIRTIVNGLCYLATFVFGLNSIGLILYSGQLAISSFMEGSNDDDDGMVSTSPPADNAVGKEEINSSTDADHSDKTN